MPSFFVLTPGDLTAQEFQSPGICHPRQKKVLMPGGQPERKLTAALTVNETISNLDHIALSVPNQLVFTF